MRANAHYGNKDVATASTKRKRESMNPIHAAAVAAAQEKQIRCPWCGKLLADLSSQVPSRQQAYAYSHPIPWRVGFGLNLDQPPGRQTPEA